MSDFEIPQGAPLPPEPVPPPVDPLVAREQQIADTTRAEEALNGFIAAQQHALFEAPDAFYRTEGSDAIHAAPAILDTLSKLRDDHLDGLANDAQRNRLAPALDAHLDLARDDVARHVAEQSLAWQRRVAQDRIALLTKQAAYHHNDDTMVDALGEAAGTAARAHARVGSDVANSDAENAAAIMARDGVLNAAFVARQGGGPIKDIIPIADNQRENKQVRDIAVQLRLTPDQVQQLHREISGQGLTFHEVLQVAKDKFGK